MGSGSRGSRTLRLELPSDQQRLIPKHPAQNPGIQLQHREVTP